MTIPPTPILTQVLAQARGLALELSAAEIVARLEELERQPVSPFLDEQAEVLREIGTLVEQLRVWLMEAPAGLPYGLRQGTSDGPRPEER